MDNLYINSQWMSFSEYIEYFPTSLFMHIVIGKI